MGTPLPSTREELSELIDQCMRKALKLSERIASGQPKRRLINQERAKYILGGVSDTTLSKRVKNGLVPPPMKMGNKNYWWEDEFCDYIEERANDELPPEVVKRLNAGPRLSHL